MAYNGIFPATYAQMYYPQPNMGPASYPAQPATPSPAQVNSNLIWVQGEAGAKSYLVAPNNTVQLWDSEKQTIYLKSADASGMPSMKVLDYTIRDVAPANAPVTASGAKAEYASKGDLQALYGRVEGLQRKLDSILAAKTPDAEVSTNEQSV